MSGFNERTSLVFLSVMNGNIVRRVDENFPGAVSRTKTKGDKGVVWEKHYGSVTGLITDIKTKEVKGFGKMWSIMLDVEGDDGNMVKAEMSLGYTSNPANCFLCCIENVDIKRPVNFSASESERKAEDGEIIKSTSLFLNQDGKAAKWAHTNKEPNGMPPKKEVIVSGKKQMDATERLAFFEKIIAEKILPHIKQVVEAPVHDVEDHTEETKDDLPF